MPVSKAKLVLLALLCALPLSARAGEADTMSKCVIKNIGTTESGEIQEDVKEIALNQRTMLVAEKFGPMTAYGEIIEGRLLRMWIATDKVGRPVQESMEKIAETGGGHIWAKSTMTGQMLDFSCQMYY